MGADRVISKYLSHYAEDVSAAAAALAGERYRTAVVVPVFQESPDCLTRLVPPRPQDEKDLLIFVVNAPEGASDGARVQNEQFLARALSSGSRARLGAGFDRVQAPFGSEACDLVVIDMTSGPLALGPKEGVGRARKVGMDLSLSLFQAQALRSSICGSTDADVTLPEGYFEALVRAGASPSRARPASSGLLFPYRHALAPDVRLRQAMTELELSFRYYVLGLDFAGSPYAYHSLGSALAVSLPHYARVRGVPNRQAGEDFYLLSKLSKLAPLERLSEPVVEIATRVSERVPFGTGPSLSRALAGEGGELEIYDPRAFEWLKALLQVLVVSVRDERDAPKDANTSVPSWVSEQARKIFDEIAPHLRACPTALHREHRLHERFDALSTLQFIHEAHRRDLSKVSIAEAFERAPFLPGSLSLSEKLEHCVHRERLLGSRIGLAPA